MLWTGSSAGLPAILNYAVSLGLDAVVEVSVLIIHLILMISFLVIEQGAESADSCTFVRSNMRKALGMSKIILDII